MSAACISCYDVRPRPFILVREHFEAQHVEAFTSNRGSDEATALKINFILIVVPKNLRKNDPVVPRDDSSRANASDYY
jgi:hypothetical protein